MVSRRKSASSESRQIASVSEFFEPLKIFDRSLIHNIPNGKLHSFMRARAWNITHLEDFCRLMALHRVLPNLQLNFFGRPFTQFQAVQQFDKQECVRVALSLLTNNNRLQDSFTLLELSINFDTADADATRIQRGIRTTLDDEPQMDSDLSVISLTPHSGKVFEIGFLALATVGVIPKINRHCRKRRKADQFVLLVITGKMIVVQNFTFRTRPLHCVSPRYQTWMPSASA